jgi:hypothetical protein
MGVQKKENEQVKGLEKEASFETVDKATINEDSIKWPTVVQKLSRGAVSWPLLIWVVTKPCSILSFTKVAMAANSLLLSPKTPQSQQQLPAGTTSVMTATIKNMVKTPPSIQSHTSAT